MVSIYKCDYCGESIQLKKPNFSPADFDDVSLAIIKDTDLCKPCQQHIFDMVKSQIDERRKIRERK